MNLDPCQMNIFGYGRRVSNGRTRPFEVGQLHRWFDTILQSRGGCRERVLEVGVMSEFARRSRGRIQEARGLVLAHFSLGKEEWIREFYPLG